MKKILSATVISLILLGGCASDPGEYKSTKTTVELQAMQTREFKSSKKNVFASVMSTFQNMGYSIKSTDFTTGFISAESPVMSVDDVWWGGQRMKNKKASAVIDDSIGKKVSVRINFVVCDEHSSSMVGGRKETPVEDATYYAETFEKIEKELFIRTNK